MEKREPVDIVIYDVLGKVCGHPLSNVLLDAGRQEIHFENNLTPGIYLIQVRKGGSVSTRKLWKGE
jgi:hypothetical protein